jgi:hypothetical protein
MSGINPTIYFTFLSGVYLIVVSIMLFVKKRSNLKEVKLFKVMVLSSFLSVTFELMLMFFASSTNLILLDVIGKIYLLTIIVWNTVFTFYAISVPYEYDNDKLIRNIKVVVFILSVCCGFLSCVLPLHYNYNNNFAFSLQGTKELLEWINTILDINLPLEKRNSNNDKNSYYIRIGGVDKVYNILYKLYNSMKDLLQ